MNRREFVKETFAVAGAAVFGLGCSKEASANETSTTNNAATPLPSTEKQGEKKMKCAVVYFSWSGNTRFAAETISKKAGADLFEIKAETPYNSNYGKCCDEAKPECYGKTLRPIKPIEGLDLAKYDLVFVGSPARGCRRARKRSRARRSASSRRMVAAECSASARSSRRPSAMR